MLLLVRPAAAPLTLLLPSTASALHPLHPLPPPSPPPHLLCVSTAPAGTPQVGPILAMVDRHTSENSNRSVTFSSFDPDVCVAARTQQSRCVCVGAPLGW